VVSVPEVSGGGWVGVESVPVVSGRPTSEFGPELSQAAAPRRSAISARREWCCGIRICGSSALGSKPAKGGAVGWPSRRHL